MKKKMPKPNNRKM